VRRLFLFPVVVLFVSLMSVGVTQAQKTGNPQSAPTPAPLTTSANQNTISSLSNLPDADTIIYFNPQRILNEVVPKVMPAKDVEEMRKGFEEVKKNFGVDPKAVEYIVVAVRFKKPTAELKFQPPEALIVAGGDINAESLIGLARMVSGGQLRDEKYGANMLGLMTIDPIAKEAEKNPFLRSLSEIGIAALNANTIAVGTPGYLRAAIDAGDGKDRISAETLNSLVRDSSAFISVAGRPWRSLAKSFGMMGTEAAERAPRCDMKIGDFYAAVTMDASNFMLRGAMNEDNPDTAKIVSNLLTGLLGYAGSSFKDPAAQSMLKNVAIAPEGDEITLRADFPQQMVVEFIQQQMKPKKEEDAVSAPKTPTKPRPRRRIRRRT
jgi:hypothetical protein